MQFATRKIGGVYEAALIVDGKFNRTGRGESLLDLFNQLCGPALTAEQQDGAEITVAVNVSTAEDVDRDRAEENLARQRAAAEREMQSLDALVEMQEKIRARRRALTNG